MKKYSSLFIILFLNCFIVSCVNKKSSKPGRNYDDWNRKIKDNISFYYPKDWAFKQSEYGQGLIYGLNPASVCDMGNYYVFEIMEMPVAGRPFKEFQNFGFNFYHTRSSAKVEIMSKEQFKFKGLQTDRVQLYLMHDDTFNTPMTLYIINGINKYYLISITRDTENSKIKINDITASILNSIEIAK